MENKKIKNSTFTTVDDIKFRSKLEARAYSLFKEHLLDFEYETETVILMEGYKAEKVPYIRPNKKNGKYEKDLSVNTKKIQDITYTPDFLIRAGECLIYMDVKGYPNDTYPLKVKMFLKHLESLNDGVQRVFMEPHNVKQIKDCINIILDNYESYKNVVG